MDITFTGQNIEVTDALRSVITKKIERVQKHFKRVLDVSIILGVQKLNHSVEAILHVPGAEIAAKGSAEDMYKAIDVMMDKLDIQIRKFKEKQQDHRE